MLALEGYPLGLVLHVLSEKNTDPGAKVGAYWCQGSPNSQRDVLEFARHLDFLTFESEFYDMENYKNLKGPQIFPSPSIMECLQHRYSQKMILKEFKIPTAPFMEVKTNEDILAAWRNFPRGFVLKKSRGGYDGFGTFYYKKKEDLEKGKALLPSEFIAEAYVPFRRELAVTIVRSVNGEIVYFPLVESHQINSRCDWVIGPTKHKKFSSLLKKLALLVREIEYVGAISFELFDTEKDLLVNEVAPRVHNSAHYSQEGLSHSQFLLHLLAALGGPLPKPRPMSAQFAMINLIGQSHDPVQIPQELYGYLHWYGKAENRPGRKMGHINYLGTSAKKILKQGLHERTKFRL